MERTALLLLALLLGPASSLVPGTRLPRRVRSRRASLAPTMLDAHGRTRVVVIGNGMVGQRFMEDLLELDKDTQSCTIATFCEEPRAACAFYLQTTNQTCNYLYSWSF